MGMPLSYFHAFWALQDPDRSGSWRAREVFKKYRLFTFVLHDPLEDPRLHARLETDWDALDALTGEHLLFFAPVDPPQAWTMRVEAEGRWPMRLERRRIGIAPDRVGTERGYRPLVSRDPSQTVAAIRQLLGVPAGMGPCLVIVSDLHSREVWLLSTRSDTVAGQLERLGSIANACAKRPLAPDGILTLVARMANDVRLVIERIGLPTSLASVLTDVCALTATQGSAGDPSIEERAWRQLRETAMVRVRDQLPMDEDATIQFLSQIGALFGSSNAPHGQSGSSSPVSGLPGNLIMSRRTRQLLTMGDNCLELLRNGAIDHSDEPDCRIAVALWAQALEHEMAELLGHEVRAGLGVALPEFHWRRQPDLKGAKVERPSRQGDGKEVISFNQARSTSPDPDRALWMPPAMGPLRLGWKWWREDSQAPVSRELMDLLGACKDLRNAASHPSEPIPFDAACAARNSFISAIRAIRELGIRDWSTVP